MALDPQLLEILACPEDKGPLLYFADEDALYNPRLQRRYAVQRGHPGDADRRGRDRRRRRARAAAGQGRGRGHRGPRSRRDAVTARAASTASPSTPSTCSASSPALPEQVADAAAAARRRHRRAARAGDVDNVVVLGMGGSGIAGDVLAAVAGAAHARCRSSCRKDYELPGFVGARTLVLAVSCSGDTEETLDGGDRGGSTPAPSWWPCARAARWPSWPASGARRTSPCAADIPMPRAALGALVRPAPVVLEEVGLCPGRASAVDDAVDAAAPPPRQLVAARQHAPRRWPAASGARSRWSTAAGPSAPSPPLRWKSQVNENAKAPAFANRLPELCHNEVAGWGQHGDVTRQVLTLVAAAPRLRAPAGRPPLRAGRRPGRRGRGGDPRGAGRGRRRRWPSCSTWCCTATSCRCTWPSRPAWTPGPIAALDYIKAGLTRRA